jgi:RNA polymerase sigma-70 factor (ECF subfamily)
MVPASDSDLPGPAADEGAPSAPGGAGADVVVQLPDGFENDETAQLVKRAQDGDVEALNDLFTRFHSLMVEVARKRLGPRLRLKEDPDDLAQTTFREATRDFKNYEYRGEGSLLRWLVQILQNKIRDKAEFYSAGKRDTSLETTLDRSTKQEAGPVVEPMAEDLSVTRQVQRGERFHLLRDALQELSPEYRQAITLVFFQGLTLREAGQRLGGRSEDALRMILRRAEAKLRSKLGTSIGTEPEE